MLNCCANRSSQTRISWAVTGWLRSTKKRSGWGSLKRSSDIGSSLQCCVEVSCSWPARQLLELIGQLARPFPRFGPGAILAAVAACLGIVDQVVPGAPALLALITLAQLT